jgi:uncharacterized protein (DUF1684 family)
MTKHSLPVVRLTISILALATIIACGQAPAPVDPAYKAEVEDWRAQRLARLTAEDGWLSLTGLYWLEEGDNPFGSAEDNAVVLPDPAVAEIAGVLSVSPDGKIAAVAEADAGVAVNGEVLVEAELKTDAQGRPDLITAGRIQFYIIDRGGKLGARVKPPQAKPRPRFTGIEHFPIDTGLKVEAAFERYDEPREVAIPTVLGEDTTMLATGLLRFTVNGSEQTLEPYVGSPEDDTFFLIFRDGTSGESTYGAGRFLSAAAPGEGDSTVLDFNLAYNPPCAFTPFATCPLPPPQNVLEVPINAGEKYTGPTH